MLLRGAVVLFDTFMKIGQDVTDLLPLALGRVLAKAAAIGLPAYGMAPRSPIAPAFIASAISSERVSPISLSGTRASVANESAVP
jgi:hypothetical protein